MLIIFVCVLGFLNTVNNKSSAVQNFHSSLDFIKMNTFTVLYFKLWFYYVNAKQLKLVGKPFAVYQKFAKTTTVELLLFTVLLTAYS